MGVGGKKISFYLHCFTYFLCWGYFVSLMITWHSIFIVYCDIKKKNQLFSSFRVCLQGQVQTNASLSVCSSNGQTWASSHPKSYRDIHMALVFWSNQQNWATWLQLLDFGQDLALSDQVRAQPEDLGLVLVQVVRLQKPSRTKWWTTVTAENSLFNDVIM